MATFYETGIDNIIVEVDCNEIPVMDGSAISFINVFLKKTGVSMQENDRRIFRISKATEYSEGKRLIIIELADALHLDVSISLTKIGRLNWSGEITPELFKQEIAAARTFGGLKNGLLAQLTRFQKDPICLGASTKTAVVIVGDKAINKGGLVGYARLVNLSPCSGYGR
jgi:UDP-3-O-[3-hydroxymyristoyl] N-acetylglucosamine deacetylase